MPASDSSSKKSNWSEWSARAASISPIYRGNIIQNSSRFKFFGNGYKEMPPEQNGFFSLDSARQIEGPCLALTHPSIRRVHVIGATQVLKSFIGDLWVMYVLEHVRRPMLVLFEDAPKALRFSQNRMMDTIRNHPFLSKMLDESNKQDRFSFTGTKVETPYSNLIVDGLNEGSVSTLTWPLLWLSEAWQHGPPALSRNDGLIFKAFKRTDRAPKDCKILNESQAGLAESDLHNAVRYARQIPLTWACPSCSGRQTFEWLHWSFRRPSDFIPRQQKPSFLTDGTMVTPETPKPGTYGGMQFPPDPEGRMRLADRAAQAYWNCIHCGYHIEDKPPVRRALAATYKQVFWNEGSPDILPDNINLIPAPDEVCFTIPFEANVTNNFAKTALHFLSAEQSKRQGNETPWIDFFLNERAVFYDRGNTMAIELAPVTGSYKADQIPNQHSINLIVDCQKALDASAEEDRVGSFWAMVCAWDKLGNSYQLWRGFLTSWDELLEIQKRFGVPNGRVCIDGRKWPAAILDMAALHFKDVEKVYLGRKYPTKETWVVMLGDDAKYFRWAVPGQKPYARNYSPPQPHPRNIQTPDGKRMSVTVSTIRWANTAIKDQVREMLLNSVNKTPGTIQFHPMDRADLDQRTKEKEVGDAIWEKQINSEFVREKNGKRFYDKLRRENHYFDILCEEMVRKQMDGLAGGIIEETAVEPSESTD